MLSDLKYWVLDVDGTLTDGGIYYDNTGNEIKKFNVKDGTGIVLAHEAGMKVIVLTGRECIATERRMKELKVDFLFQNVKNKAEFLNRFFCDNHIDSNAVGYIGDDLNDLASMKIVGFSACPSDACDDVKQYVDYVSCAKGGYGAVREIIEYVLKQDERWGQAAEEIYGTIGKDILQMLEQNLNTYDKILFINTPEFFQVLSQLKPDHLHNQKILLLSPYPIPCQMKAITCRQLSAQEASYLTKLYFTYEFSDKFLFISQEEKNYAGLYHLADTGILSIEEVIQILLK